MLRALVSRPPGRREPLPRSQALHLPAHVLRGGVDRLGDPAAHARRSDQRVSSRGSRRTRPPSQELHGYFTESFGLDEPLWRQYLNFWLGLVARRPRAEHRLRRLLGQRPDPAAIPYTLALLDSRDRAQLHRREPGGRDGRAAEGARQHRAAGRLRPHGHAVHVARARARLLARVPLADLPGLGRVRLRAPAGLDVGVRAQLPRRTGSSRSSRSSSSRSAAGRSGCAT